VSDLIARYRALALAFGQQRQRLIAQFEANDLLPDPWKEVEPEIARSLRFLPRADLAFAYLSEAEQAVVEIVNELARRLLRSLGSPARVYQKMARECESLALRKKRIKSAHAAQFRRETAFRLVLLESKVPFDRMMRQIPRAIGVLRSLERRVVEAICAAEQIAVTVKRRTARQVKKVRRDALLEELQDAHPEASRSRLAELAKQDERILGLGLPVSQNVIRDVLTRKRRRHSRR
jgi:hypothetical protein